MVVPLDDLYEDGGSVLHGLGEDLQQVAVVVIVDQDLQLLQLGQVLRHLHTRLSGDQHYHEEGRMCLLASMLSKYNIKFLQQQYCPPSHASHLHFGVCEALPQHVVVGVRDVEELLASGSQVCDGLDNVMRPEANSC